MEKSQKKSMKIKLILMVKILRPSLMRKMKRNEN